MRTLYRTTRPRAIVPLIAFLSLFGCSNHPSHRNVQSNINPPPAPVSNSQGDSEPPGALDAELTRFTYPWPVKQFHFQSQKQSLQMSYMDLVPTTTNGKTVVLMHGKNFASNYWEATAEVLAKSGFRVLMIDQLGFGKSSKPENYVFTLQELANNTHLLLKSVGVQKSILLGHSMGGMLSIRYTLMFPTEVEKLILINPIGLEDWKLSVPYRTVDELYHQELTASADSVREYVRSSYFGGIWRPEYERLIEIPIGWQKSRDYTRLAWITAQTTEMIFTQPIVYELNRLRLPTLLIIGQKDRTAIGKSWASPEAKEKLGDYHALGRIAQKLIPRSQLIEIPNAGHLPQVENFAAVREALLSFLN